MRQLAFTQHLFYLATESIVVYVKLYLVPYLLLAEQRPDHERRPQNPRVHLGCRFVVQVTDQLVDTGQLLCRSSKVNLGRLVSKLNYVLIYVVPTLYIFLNQFVIYQITTN